MSAAALGLDRGLFLVSHVVVITFHLAFPQILTRQNMFVTVSARNHFLDVRKLLCITPADTLAHFHDLTLFCCTENNLSFKTMTKCVRSIFHP